MYFKLVLVYTILKSNETCIAGGDANKIECRGRCGLFNDMTSCEEEGLFAEGKCKIDANHNAYCE